MWLCLHRLCSLGTRRGWVKLGASLTLTTPGGALGQEAGIQVPGCLLGTLMDTLR